MEKMKPTVININTANNIPQHQQQQPQYNQNQNPQYQPQQQQPGPPPQSQNQPIDPQQPQQQQFASSPNSGFGGHPTSSARQRFPFYVSCFSFKFRFTSFVSPFIYPFHKV